MKQGLVSIIVPCYNQGLYLKECLESILQQTYSQWECIIVDDGSSDNLEQIANTFSEQDSRFRYIYQSNQGVSAARNNGIKISGGEYILPLDGDDKIGKTYLDEAVLILKNKQNIKLVYCKAAFFGEVNKPWQLPVFSIKRMLRDNIIFCSAIFRRMDFNKTKGYNPDFYYCWEDWDFWLTMLESGGEVVKLNSLNFFYRIRKNSRNISSQNNDKEKMLELLYLNHKTLFDNSNVNPLAVYRKREKAKMKMETSSKFLKIINTYWNTFVIFYRSKI